jgi:hypothetical protein
LHFSPFGKGAEGEFRKAISKSKFILKRKKGQKMKKYVVRPHELPTYSPPKHSGTTNRRLLGPGPSGSDRMEVVLGELEYGGQADPHVHPDLEQAFFVLLVLGVVYI